MSDYQAMLVCRRCKRERFVPKLALRYRHWFCHRREDGRYCWTFNIWEHA